MFTEFNRIFSLEVDLKNLEVTYNSKALYTNVDLNTSIMMIKMSLDQNALDLTGKTVNAFIKTGIDKNITMQRCEILEATEGIIGLDFKSSALKAGTNTFFLEIKSNNEEIINSPLITYKVVELFDTYSSIEGDNNVSILTELITEVDIAKGSVEVLKNEITEQERQREEAEASRKNNESSRIQAETNRTNSESTRVTNENNRNQAESTRESNETKRVNAENLRESAENTRIQEETKRSQNESLRVESEKERVLSYEEIKNNNAIFKEQMNTDFGNAKTDYFGEEHPNVVERLNSDFDNLHQRMNDSSLLQYEGTSIKADNSYYGLTKDMSIKGRTLQNILSKFNAENLQKSDNVTFDYDNKTITILGTSTWNEVVFLKCNLLKDLTTYTIIFEITNNTLDYGRIRVARNHNVGVNETITTKETGIFRVKFTTNSSAATDWKVRSFWIGLTPENKSGEITIKNIILLEGDHTNTPIENLPYFEGIYSVGENEVTEDGRYKISGKSCGKNLCNITNLDFKAITSGNPGSYFSLIDSKTRVTLTIPTKINNGKTYTINFNNSKYQAFICGVTNGISMFNISWFTGAKTSVLNSEYVYISFRKTDSSVITNTEFDEIKQMNVQLEESSTATSFEPYQESTYEYILEEPLRSLPNGVADTIEGNKVIRRVAKVVLDGSENWDKSDSEELELTSFFYVNINGKASNTHDRHLCDRFIYKGNAMSSMGDLECYGAYTSNPKSINIRILKSRLTTNDVSGFKTWLQANPTTVYYELVEPIVTELDETLQLKSYDGTTHITSDNYLLPITSAKIPSNVQAVVSSLITENKELTEEVSTLSVENEELKQTNKIQDELIDINMCATDEMYVLLEPLLAQSISTMSLEREVSKMVDLYVAMIQRGLKTIEQVPERYREQVREVLEQLEK